MLTQDISLENLDARKGLGFRVLSWQQLAMLTQDINLKNLDARKGLGFRVS